MNYQHYQAADFALDPYFQQWVLQPDSELNQFWNTWIQQHPDKVEEITEAIELVRLSGLSNDAEANRQYLQTWQQLHRHLQDSQRPQPKRAYWQMAALWTGLLLLSGYLIWSFLQHQPATEYSTRYGEIKEFVLPDGSKVTLNAHSTLTLLGSHWGTHSAREVQLRGEAFFEVVKTSDHRQFIVKTPDQVDVQVLGTTFNVNTRREQTAVYLASGKVNLQAPAQAVMMKPGELAAYDKQTGQVKVALAAADKSVSWKSRYFVFDDTPLSEVSREMEEYFGTAVIIAADSLANARLTARVPRHNQGLLLKVIEETLGADIQQHRDGITIQIKKD